MSSAIVKLTFVLLATIALNFLQVAADDSPEEKIMGWLQEQEVSLKVPGIDSEVQISARNLQDDEVDVKVQISSQGRKSKLKKIFAPILILVILKAITLIPLALGVLGLKAWNAIQLAFVTFVISISLAVYELCKKVVTDQAPIVTHSAPWPGKRSFDGEEAQKMAYSAYLEY